MSPWISQAGTICTSYSFFTAATNYTCQATPLCTCHSFGRANTKPAT
ncbi:MAG: hypothetical protein E6Y49_18555 [Clostridium sporogenes]|nr:hypothetical protein [Clostridium sporogenes]